MLWDAAVRFSHASPILVAPASGDAPRAVSMTRQWLEEHDHRELAANIPFGGTHPGRAGTAADRNVELLISPPFPLARLPGA